MKLLEKFSSPASQGLNKCIFLKKHFAIFQGAVKTIGVSIFIGCQSVVY